MYAQGGFDLSYQPSRIRAEHDSFATHEIDFHELLEKYTSGMRSKTMVGHIHAWSMNFGDKPMTLQDLQKQVSAV